jgi:hypothetical protein
MWQVGTVAIIARLANQSTRNALCKIFWVKILILINLVFFANVVETAIFHNRLSEMGKILWRNHL